MKPPEWFKDTADWIPKKLYLELYKETDAAVHKRIVSKVWKAGVQYARPEGAGLWISIKGVNAWASAHVERASGPGSA